MSRQVHLSALVSSLETLGRRLDQLLERNLFRLFLAYSFVYFLATLVLARIKLLWLDEFTTLYVSRFHSLSELWSVLKAAVDMNPPLYHLLTRACIWLLGENEIAIRLPAVLGFWAMTVSVFIFVRRRAGALVAGIAALFPFTTVTYFYAFEGRPYGIMLGCGGVSLLAWQLACEGRWRKLWLPGLGLSLMVAVSCHYYAVLLLGPLCLGQAVRDYSRRRVDIWMWLSILAGALPIALFRPLIRGGLRVYGNEHVWNPPDPAFLTESYPCLLGYAGALALIVFLCCLARLFRNRKQRLHDFGNLPGHELALLFGLALLPFFAFPVALLAAKMVTWRYVVPMVIGVAVLFAISWWELGDRRHAAAVVALALVCAGVAYSFGSSLYRSIANSDAYSNPALNAIFRARNIPIVAKPVQVLPLAYYAEPEFRSRIVSVIDLKKLHAYEPVDTLDRILVVGRSVYPVRQVNYSEFRQRERDFFILGGPVGWLEDEVFREGGTVTIAYQSEYNLIFYASYDRNRSAPVIRAAAPR
jgi:hypothetical protein